ncbi:energy-coupling factor transporter transmembrane component T [Paenibacillus whitsoniae]|uniref:Energy-coupling factor transporter transmembrane protein EcfT n=1 Tax=Paenibacillus whitsoniae TaxID=2496558 RepID=A0A3S0ASU7_9BACL|nr:energy-coupling factor transporter transmembrane component T [Paenibacillus whitsoniae]RTE11796.1 energy-coupling factor transporter transmembrane protein EcfT [Paenibacillus whitsoniae]
MRRDSFAAYHPVLNFAYYAAVLLCSMLFLHPVLQVFSLLGALLYALRLRGRTALRFSLIYMLPLLVVTAVLNPLWHHAGVTILFYLHNGNPITLESVLYGAASACMFVTVVLWFTSFNVVITSDKWMYVFGKMMPALALMFSMTLRFVPRYAAQLRKIASAQRTIGREAAQGSVLGRARHGLRLVSILTTWALENAIDTADAMKARGYGLPGRTSFALYRWARRDSALAVALGVLLGIVAASVWTGQNAIRFFPSLKFQTLTPLGLAGDAAWGILCLLPVAIQLVEDLRWKFIISRI